MPAENDDLPPDPEGGGEPPKPPSNRDLREKLETALANLRAVQQENMLYKAGLGHLNERQVKAVLSTFGKDDEVTQKSLQDAVKELGWEKSTTPPPNGDTDPASSATSTTPNPADTAIAESITGLSDQELAHIMSLRGGGTLTTTEEFGRKINEAQSPEAVLAILNQFGPSVGVMNEHQID
jgi:hypothetical protein